MQVNTEIPRRADVFVDAFAKGLAVINAFNQHKGAVTLSEVAKSAQLPAASTRRLLYTLVHLGYARTRDRKFELSPKVLELGFSYLNALPFRDVARSLIDDFAQEMGEVCTVTVLDGSDVVYVARADVRTQLSSTVGVGGRLPTHATSSGLVLLAALAPEELNTYLQQAPFPKFTERTRSDADAIREAVHLVKKNGWMLSSEELELGVCGLAIPVKNHKGETVASLGVSVNLARYTESQVVELFLPKLGNIAEQIRHLMS